MNGRFAIILICILCGALLLAAGCTMPIPTGETTPTPVPRSTVASQPATSATDIGSLTTLLQSIDERLSTVVENTRPLGAGIETGNIILFDDEGNKANAIASGTSIVALPAGSCDVAVFSEMVPLFVTLEEEKDVRTGGTDQRYYRNRQNCFNEIMCRRTVQLDNDFAFLYVEYKPYNPVNALSQVTLAYRCRPA